MMSIPVRTVIIITCFILNTFGQCVFADGGVVLFKSDADPYTITVFGSPAPLRAGISDISVLVQNVNDGKPELQCDLKLSVSLLEPEASGKAWQPPCCSMHGPDDKAIELTRSHSQNRILYGGFVTLPQPGRWRILLEISNANLHRTIEHEVVVGPSASPIQAYWPLLVLPLAVGGLIGVHYRLRCRS